MTSKFLAEQAGGWGHSLYERESMMRYKVSKNGDIFCFGHVASKVPVGHLIETVLNWGNIIKQNRKV